MKSFKIEQEHTRDVKNNERNRLIIMKSHQ